MKGAPDVQLRRVGARRAWPLRRVRPEYEIVVRRNGSEIYRARTVVPAAVLVTKGEVHTTDSWDWVRAADQAFERRDTGWISDPFSQS